MNASQIHLLEQLENLPLEVARMAIATGKYGEIGSPNHDFCSSWLFAKDSNARAERDAGMFEIASKSLALATEDLAIARDNAAAALAASESAREQARWARWAAMIATIAAMIAIKDDMLRLIF